MSATLILLVNLTLIILVAAWLRFLVVRRLDRTRLLSEFREEIGVLVTELNRTGDQNVTVIEDRIARLRTLVASADTQIEELEALVDRASGERHAASHLADDTSESASSLDSQSDEPAADPRGAPPDGPNDDMEPATDGLGSVSEQGVPSSAQTEQPDATPREVVAALWRQGLSPEVIATRTSTAIGEVELMISLLERRGARR